MIRTRAVRPGLALALAVALFGLAETAVRPAHWHPQRAVPGCDVCAAAHLPAVDARVEVALDAPGTRAWWLTPEPCAAAPRTFACTRSTRAPPVSSRG